MADPGKIIERVRSYGANIVLDGDSIRIVNAKRLPPAAREVILANRNAICAALQTDENISFEERAAIIEFDGKAPREWAEQFARILVAGKPAGIDDFDWSWFITACGRIIDEAPERREA